MICTAPARGTITYRDSGTGRMRLSRQIANRYGVTRCGQLHRSFETIKIMVISEL